MEENRWPKKSWIWEQERKKKPISKNMGRRGRRINEKQETE
jgi:hypothetical protein